MLLYESARTLHGRRTQLKGKYYGSVFLRYQVCSYFIDLSNLHKFICFFNINLASRYIYLEFYNGGTILISTVAYYRVKVTSRIISNHSIVNMSGCYS